MGVRSSFKGGVKDNGLILHYDAGKVDSYNRSGLVINDLSESKTTGGLTGSTIRWSNSNGGIIIFDGTSTKINIGTPTNLQFTNTQPFTISVWFKWTEPSSVFGNLVTYAAASGAGWYLGIDSSGTVGLNVAYIDYYDGSTFRGIQSANNSIIKNAWTNITVTNSGVNSVSGMKIYSNGSLLTTTTRALGNGTPNSVNYTGLTSQVGSRGNATYFEGNISQVMIYNRELSAAEVLQNYTNFRSRISLRGIDSDADNFLKAAHIEDATQAMAVNNLVLDLKKYGLWSKMRAIYPVVGGNAWSHKFNLKDPRDADDAFRLTFSGTWTHTTTGMTPTTAYANTYYSGSSNVDAHLSIYSRTQSVGAGNTTEIGAYDTTGGGILFQIGVAKSFYSDDTTTPVNFTTTTDARGFWIGVRRSNTDREGYRNGISERSVINASSRITLPLSSNYIGARNSYLGVDNYSSKEISFATQGLGITDTEAANFYTAVQSFQTLLGRQV
jgi:hypothetical protein